jgi:hypothetical protein
MPEIGQIIPNQACCGGEYPDGVAIMQERTSHDVFG